MFRSIVLVAIAVRLCAAANLSVSTYFRDGFTPAAIASDPAGSIYVAGTARTDPQSSSTSIAAV